MPDAERAHIRAVGESARLIELGATSPATTARGRLLAATIRDAAWEGVHDAVPAYCTVLVQFDPCLVKGTELDQRVLQLLAGIREAPDAMGRVIEFPVLYGGECGPDLADVAAHTGIPAEEVIRRHSDGIYRVEFLGFSPGFAYLSGLPEELATPRLKAPRIRVPAGSVAIGGIQTGFYPLGSPGGWRLIGRIPALSFDPARPDTLPYAPGDTIRFTPIDAERFATLEGQVRSARSPVTGQGKNTTRGLRVIRAGAQATVQDMGRRGLASLGYATAGALDTFAHSIANLLVTNIPDAATIELALDGGEFEAIGDLAIAVTGADLRPEIEGEPVSAWRATTLRDGARLRFGARRSGMRAYLAVAGGIDTPLLLGSRSTDVLAGIGGMEGRALRAGDILPVGESRREGAGFALEPHSIPRYGNAIEVRIIWGPQDGWFGEHARAEFVTRPFTASTRGDRTGLRLIGPSISTLRQQNLASEGGVPGVIQVPPDGQPIVLLADGRGVGGYPKIATVIAADLPQLGQAAPGTQVHFRPVTLDEAQHLACSGTQTVREHLTPVPELDTRCLMEVGGQRPYEPACPRSLACLVSQRCLLPTGQQWAGQE